MTRKLDPSSPPTLQQIAKTFRITGWTSLWAQIVLTIVSSGILIVAAFSSRNPVPNPATPGIPAPAPAPNPSSGAGGFFTFCAILALFFTIYWSFRYVLIGRQLRRDVAVRPKRSETIQVLQTGLLASLAGMLLALLGTFAIVGTLAVIAFRQAPGFVGSSFSQFVNSLDILVVQASIMLILAHFFGTIGSLWLLNRISR
ncbi:MAG: DUF3611 family protein [Leptolyngbyaceae cyanobacterium RU_5_1]|nr:DUF3611 family protein [Leptolyngbyaceae cyanobacterium RU_5_1]